MKFDHYVFGAELRTSRYAERSLNRLLYLYSTIGFGKLHYRCSNGNDGLWCDAQISYSFQIRVGVAGAGDRSKQNIPLLGRSLWWSVQHEDLAINDVDWRTERYRSVCESQQNLLWYVWSLWIVESWSWTLLHKFKVDSLELNKT